MNHLAIGFPSGRDSEGWGGHRAQGLPDVPACPRLTLSPSLCSAAAAVLNTAIQAPVQPAQPLQAAVQPRAPLQPPGVFPAAPGQPPILPQPPAAPTPPVAKPLETQTQITVQPAGFAFNPGIVRTWQLVAWSRASSGSVPLSPVPYVAAESGEKLSFPRGRSALVLPSSPGGSCRIPASVSPSPAKHERPSRKLCFGQESKGWI